LILVILSMKKLKALYAGHCKKRQAKKYFLDIDQVGLRVIF